MKLRKGGERFFLNSGKRPSNSGLDHHRPVPLVQASAPRPVRPRFAGPATLGKPLNREFLFYPCQHLSMLVGSGLFVAREPRLPRVPETRAPKRFAVKHLSAQQLS